MEDGRSDVMLASTVMIVFLAKELVAAIVLASQLWNRLFRSGLYNWLQVYAKFNVVVQLVLQYLTNDIVRVYLCSFGRFQMHIVNLNWSVLVVVVVRHRE